jgi:hypothetical protein
MISTCLLLPSPFIYTRMSACMHTHRVTLLPSLWPLLLLWQYWQLQEQHISSALYMYCSSYPSISLKLHRSVTSLLMAVLSQLPFCIPGHDNLWIYMCIHLIKHNCQLHSVGYRLGCYMYDVAINTYTWCPDSLVPNQPYTLKLAGKSLLLPSFSYRIFCTC